MNLSSPPPSRATCLTIAGSDPSGGAGIQADLRVLAALGVTGLSAVTALTVQNSQGVQSVHPARAEVLAAQIEAILTDSSVQAVKVGMLGGAPQVRAVADALRRHRPPNVVLDPVLASTGGVTLLDDEGRHTLLTELLPLCDLVTPNLEETETLGGAGREAVPRLLAAGASAVLVKGGHATGAPVDVLYPREALQPGGTLAAGTCTTFSAERVEIRHTHGTGCFLATAIAAHLALRQPLEDAIREAKRLLTEALRHPVIVGGGRGYPDPFAALAARASTGEPSAPQTASPSAAGPLERTHAGRLSLLRGVYVLTDPDLRPDRLPEEIVRAALAGGARVIQLREKRLETPALVGLAKRLQRRVAAAGALFIVNDRVDVALASGADGVHLGPDDMHPADARRVLGPDRLVGVSTGTVEEARAMAPYASYLGVGAIYGSRTKRDAGAPVGVERLEQIRSAVPNVPIVAIGGITTRNIAEVARAGAEAAAVISAVITAPDMELAIRDLAARFATPPGDRRRS